MMIRRPYSLLSVLLIVCIFTIDSAHAGRRGVRVDLGAWNPPQEVFLGGGNGACPEASWFAGFLVPDSNDLYFWGSVNWMDFQFQTSAFVGLINMTCQTSKPYTPGAQPEEYLNEAIFPVDEAGLGAYIGANTDNAVHAIRYSFTGEGAEGVYGRQWTFYFFSHGEVIVSLHGVLPAQITYEWIYDNANGQYAWRAEDNLFWNGEYFCFYDYGTGAFQFSGTCEPAPPLPEEYIFDDSFE